MTEEERTQLRMNAMQDIGNELAVPPEGSGSGGPASDSVLDFDETAAR